MYKLLSKTLQMYLAFKNKYSKETFNGFYAVNKVQMNKVMTHILRVY